MRGLRPSRRGCAGRTRRRQRRNREPGDRAGDGRVLPRRRKCRGLPGGGDRRRILVAWHRGGGRRSARGRRPRCTEMEGRAQRRDRGCDHGGHGCRASPEHPAIRRGPAVHGAGNTRPVLGRGPVLRRRMACAAGPHQQHEHADSGGHIGCVRLQRLCNPVRWPGCTRGRRRRDLLRHLDCHYRPRAARSFPGSPGEGQGFRRAQGAGRTEPKDGARCQERGRVRRPSRRGGGGRPRAGPAGGESRHRRRGGRGCLVGRRVDADGREPPHREGAREPGCTARR